MKYKVGDKVKVFEKGRKATIIMLDGSTTLVRFENGQKEWVSTELIHQCYRALYEQEKVLREAAEKVLESYANGVVNNLPDENYDKVIAYYQQLKSNHNAKN